MPPDAPTTKKTLVLFTKALRQIEREMLVYVAVTETLKQRFGLDAEIDQMIEAAKDLPAIEQQLHEKYDVPLEKLLLVIDSDDLQRQWLSLLERVGSKGQPN